MHDNAINSVLFNKIAPFYHLTIGVIIHDPALSFNQNKQYNRDRQQT